MEQHREKSRSQDTSLETTKSKSSQTEKTDTWEEGETTNKEDSSTNSVKASAGFSFMGASAREESI